MKKIIDGIIVVEGKSDVAFLEHFIDAEFVTTNGSDIPNETIQYLKKSSEKRQIFVLTDPDSPGKRIRDILDNEINNLHHCFINKENSIKHGKVGVAESTQDEVIKALENSFTKQKKPAGNITIADLYNLGLIGEENSLEKRLNVSRKLNLGYCNAKTFLKRINNNGITIKEIESLL